MAVIFKPKGTLNVATAPAKLPDIDMSRCKNLVLDRDGVITTRHGNSKIYDNLIAVGIDLILGQGEELYFFLKDGAFYKDQNVLSFLGFLVAESGDVILLEDGGKLLWEAPR